MSPEAFGDAVDHVYAAVLDPDAWTTALDRVQRAVSGCGAILGIDASGQPSFVSATGYPDEALESFGSYYAGKSYVWGQFSRAAEGQWLHDRQVMSEERRRRDVFANEWATQYDTTDCTIFPLLKRGERTAFAIFARSPGAGPFDGETLSHLGRLAPHLKRAAQMKIEMDHRQVHADLALSAIDRLQDGMMFVRADGSVAHANAAAEALLANADSGLTVRGGKLRSRDPAEASALRRLIADAAGSRSSRRRAGGALSIRRSDAEHPLILLCAPIGLEHGLNLDDQPTVLILMSLADRGAATPPEALAALFRLTPAETRLAGRLADGASLSEVADELGLAKTTIVSQLSAVFRKTQTRRQGELIRLLHALPRIAAN